MASLILDEQFFTSLPRDTWSRAFESAGQLLERVALSGSFRLEYVDAIYYLEMEPGILITDVLFGSQKLVSHDAALLLMSALNRCRSFEAGGIENAIIDGSESRASAGLVRAFTLVQEGSEAGVLDPSWSARNGLCRSVTVGGKTCDVPFLSESNQIPAFIRWTITFSRVDDVEFARRWQGAFPGLYFVPGLDRQFRKFQTPFEDLRPDLVRHLTALNDGFVSIANECRWSVVDIQQRLNAEFQVDASPESTKTRASTKLMRHRDVSLNNATIRCEWHTKLRATTDRIHFHPPVPEISGDRLIIGIFTDHLPLDG